MEGTTEGMYLFELGSCDRYQIVLRCATNSGTRVMLAGNHGFQMLGYRISSDTKS